jgi:hypothetical protein
MNDEPEYSDLVPPISLRAMRLKLELIEKLEHVPEERLLGLLIAIRLIRASDPPAPVSIN